MSPLVQILRPTPEDLKNMKVSSWSIWEKEVSVFDWYYDERETCYILAGQATVKTSDGEISFKEGDLVIFSKGLKCQWRITQNIRKHYWFG